MPEWPAPPRVRACATTRMGGMSLAPYDSFNLSEHTGDDPMAVRANRNALYAALVTGAPPRWLEQQHGARVIDPADADSGPQADGACTSAAGIVCAVLTADCLPVLLCDRDGTRVAALHCGWRGIARGIISAGIAAMQRPPSGLLAWLGPAIGPAVYEVGEDVRQALTTMSGALAAAFQPASADHWYLDLTGAARMLLEQHGVSCVYGGEHCTYTEPDRFFSHRRDGVTGRMATCIWLEAPSAPTYAELP
ncbi:MAG: peptidoglycan editing factor PgeF [Gammaproteobacteria bacterium]|nr:peptidoglycan editing factor PgeF [Gammaproteobacteria bacterium]